MFPFLIGKVLTGIGHKEVQFQVVLFPFLIGKVLTRYRSGGESRSSHDVSIPYR